MPRASTWERGWYENAIVLALKRKTALLAARPGRPDPTDIPPFRSSGDILPVTPPPELPPGLKGHAGADDPIKRFSFSQVEDQISRKTFTLFLNSLK